jgi:hypothetical protein
MYPPKPLGDLGGWFDLSDYRADVAHSSLEIELCLDIDPERGCRAEELAEPQCSVCSNPRFPAR